MLRLVRLARLHLSSVVRLSSRLEPGPQQRLAALAVRLFAQVADEDPLNGRYSRKLDWAARLHEIGTHISHEQSYRHGA